MSCSKKLKVRTKYLEAILGLFKRLEISKELIREYVTVSGCCCCMPLLYNHFDGLVQLCAQKNTERVGQGEVGGVTGRVLCTWWLLG